MDISLILRYFFFISFFLRGHSAANREQATAMADSVKILLKTIAKPGRLTVIACWNSGNGNIISTKGFFFLNK